MLLTIPNFDTAGSGKALLNVATRLDKKRFEAHILCRHDRGELFQTVVGSGIPVHVFDYVNEMRPVHTGLAGCWRVSRKLRAIRPDIIHSYHYAADYSEAIAAKMAGCKWIYTKKNMSWGGSSRNGWRLRTWLADRIAVQNTEMTKQFFAKDEHKTRLVPRGIDTDSFQPEGTRAPRSNCTIICVANLVPVKGVEILLSAFSQICHDTKDAGWSLRIVGDDQNKYGDQLKSRYKDLIDSGRLIFRGKLLDVRPDLRKSDIFVLPTLGTGRMEGCPVSLLEAMSMGLVVLGSDIPGIRDQLRGIAEHQLVEPGNVAALAEGMRKIMNLTASERQMLGRQLREHCCLNWNIQKEVMLHEKLYEGMFV